jgi:outer membrane protein OmpA-like peptidoglycan-associated protein
MKLINLFFLLSLSCLIIAQNPIQGVWKGVLLRDGFNEKDALVFYLDLKINTNEISGKTREEVYDTDNFAVKKIKGNFDDNKLNFTEFVIEAQKSNSKISWCNSDFKGEYNELTGYLSGVFISNSCKRLAGKFILYRDTTTFRYKEEKLISHVWRDVLLKDIKAGYNAPEIRKFERDNFKFYPIYFDHDKTEIKEEFHSYLLKMIRVVNGHSDLRIQITGHTDDVGSDIYNIDLSKRRAKSIEDFFKANGLELTKLKIDFKGETEPIDNNQTEEGKRKNRRVDFKFI